MKYLLILASIFTLAGCNGLAESEKLSLNATNKYHAQLKEQDICFVGHNGTDHLGRMSARIELCSTGEKYKIDSPYYKLNFKIYVSESSVDILFPKEWLESHYTHLDKFFMAKDGVFEDVLLFNKAYLARQSSIKRSHEIEEKSQLITLTEDEKTRMKERQEAHICKPGRACVQA